MVERNGTFCGVVTPELLEQAPDEALVGDVANGGPVVSADDGLDDALGALADHHAAWAPVVADGRLAGVLSARDAMTAYRRALAGNVRQVRGLGASGIYLEADLSNSSALVGSSVAEVDWPPDVVLVAIDRGDSLIVPRGDVRMAAGDHLSLFVAPGSESAARELLGQQPVTTPFAAESA